MTRQEFLKELSQTPEFAKHPILKALLNKDSDAPTEPKGTRQYADMAYWKRA